MIPVKRQHGCRLISSNATSITSSMFSISLTLPFSLVFWCPAHATQVGGEAPTGGWFAPMRQWNAKCWYFDGSLKAAGQWSWWSCSLAVPCLYTRHAGRLNLCILLIITEKWHYQRLFILAIIAFYQTSIIFLQKSGFPFSLLIFITKQMLLSYNPLQAKHTLDMFLHLIWWWYKLL